MNEVDLKRRAEELEQTLQLQLAQLKKDSETWLKVGGAALAVAVLTITITNRRRNKKRKMSRHLKQAVQEPVHQIAKKTMNSSFFPPIKKRLFMALLSLGQAKLMAELKKRQQKWNEG